MTIKNGQYNSLLFPAKPLGRPACFKGAKSCPWTGASQRSSLLSSRSMPRRRVQGPKRSTQLGFSRQTNISHDKGYHIGANSAGKSSLTVQAREWGVSS